ncbi:hypothetical protein VB796_21115 [Arcicella sp. LKC2W]|uniref:hypothetical protein n=1 Tax=Arcicella sp. LKC2W TaxID=2984198 RepID=UPI002B210058|nr:hypothetical protein [Arcicella sp. LKC2W]MEA5461581.1 hypothetical protein [Arcicella sp. LKC2W]
MKILRPHAAERAKAVQDEFDRMVTTEGRKSPWAISKLAKKYFLAPRTVEDIVYRIGVYGDKVKKNKEFENQLDLFDAITNEEDNGNEGQNN